MNMYFHFNNFIIPYHSVIFIERKANEVAFFLKGYKLETKYEDVKEQIDQYNKWLTSSLRAFH
jgi:hypothetical protein